MFLNGPLQLLRPGLFKRSNASEFDMIKKYGNLFAK